ncbi:hypothetical protein Pan216_21960 [Planctomycetes bacterium Pan216]|uniref:Uncharacterized protein n=1 Tax=Kolteria novifilia TaxID=2527975 RepID=A0A518B2X8_9BACT|nr:hypothetical protein Pan216_21960 [Planctomycetes bacterium Pan216]
MLKACVPEDMRLDADASGGLTLLESRSTEWPPWEGIHGSQDLLDEKAERFD